MRGNVLEIYRVKRVEVYEIEYRELEKLIAEVYGRGVSLAVMQGWTNDSDYFFEVVAQPLDEYDESELEDWKHGKEVNGLLPTILQDMAIRGVIPAGNYLVSVMW